LLEADIVRAEEAEPLEGEVQALKDQLRAVQTELKQRITMQAAAAAAATAAPSSSSSSGGGGGAGAVAGPQTEALEARVRQLEADKVRPGM
jgi:hypothetical protein